MIEVLSRLLAMHARIDADGLVVIDGGFLTRFWVDPSHRSTAAFNSSFIWRTMNQPAHTSSAWKQRSTLTMSRLLGSRRTSPWASHPRYCSSLLVLHLRRQGDYSVAVRVDGDEVARLPLNATFRLE